MAAKIIQAGRVVVQVGFADETCAWTETTANGKRTYWLMVAVVRKGEMSAFEVVVGPFTFIAGIAKKMK